MMEAQSATENNANELTLEEKVLIESMRSGFSMAELADSMGVSRNVIAGKVFRARKKAGLIPDSPLDKTITKKEREVRRSKLSQEAYEINKQSQVIAFPTKGVISTPPAKPKKIRYRMIDPKNQVTLVELTAAKCRWPLGDPRQSDFRFCGCLPKEGSPYCPEHSDMAYVEPKTRFRAHNGSRKWR